MEKYKESNTKQRSWDSSFDIKQNSHESKQTLLGLQKLKCFNLLGGYNNELACT